MPKDFPDSRSRKVVLISRRIIEFESLLVGLLSILRFPIHELRSLWPQVPGVRLCLILLGACTAAVLFLLQPEEVRKKLGAGAFAVPFASGLGMAAGAYVLYTGATTNTSIYHQVAFCAIGTILLGEVWIVNKSAARPESQATVAPISTSVIS